MSISNSSKPTALFNRDDLVFWELPTGKIGKEGKRVIQKGQKGHTCRFYAMKRLLTTEQIRSEHGKLCSQRRKMITAEGTEFSSQNAFHQARTKANVAFLKAKGKDPEEAAHQFWSKTLKQVMTDVATFLTQDKIEQLMAQAAPVFAETRPWYHLEHMEGAADQLVDEGHGLKEVTCEEIATGCALIKTLQKRGPLMITGCFGKYFYVKEPILFTTHQIGTHIPYGWPKNSPTSKEMEVGHAIVLIGAKIQEGKQYVYWINPEDPNDPANPASQRVYISSFDLIATRMTTLAGVPMEEINIQARAVIAGALYNPSLL